MLKPRVFCCAVPVLDVRRDIHDISGLEFLSWFAVLLIVPASGYGYENLSAVFRGVVDVPFVVAARLKCYVEGCDLLKCQRIQPAFSGEVFSCDGVGFSYSPAMVLGVPTGIVLLSTSDDRVPESPSASPQYSSNNAHIPANSFLLINFCLLCWGKFV